MATTITAVALVPALTLMRRGMTLGREIETRNLLSTFGVSKLEEHMAITAATWTTASDSGSFSGEGYSTIRYQVARVEDTAGGDLSDQLMEITVSVWEDETANTTLDADELQVTFRGKIAKLATYEDEAAP